MRPIGFSTGALAYGDFQHGLSIVRDCHLNTVELSALRESELQPLIHALDDLDLNGFEYISFHAPNQLKTVSEAQVIEFLGPVAEKNWPLVVHPDVIGDFDSWRIFGDLLCIENMDKRKPIGQTARELALIFGKLPEASLCLDLGHAHQVDRTMSVAWEIFRQFGPRLRQLHVSAVNTNSRHDPLSYETILAFQKVSALVPESIPVILESRVAAEQVPKEVQTCQEALLRLTAA